MDRQQLPASPDLRLTFQEQRLAELVEHSKWIRRYAGICALVAAALGALYALTILAALIVASTNS